MNDQYLQVAGSFECAVINPEGGWFGETKEKGTPYIRIQVEVMEGPEQGKLAQWAGWLTEKSQDNTIARISEALAWDGDLRALRDGCLIGRSCNVTTEMETYNGKTKCKVAWLNPPGGGGGQAAPLEEGKVNSLISKLSARAKAVAKEVGKVAKPGEKKAKAAAPQVEEDDVPF